jgi:solute carrier family 35 protein E3
MAERSTDREPSISSSTTAAEAYDDNEKNGGVGATEGSYTNLKTPDELDIGDDVERAELLPEEHEKPPPKAPENTTRSAVIWMVVNTLATIGIVSLMHSPVG